MKSIVRSLGEYGDMSNRLFRLQKSTPEDNEDHHLLLQVCEQLDLQTKYLNDSIAEIEFKVKVSLLFSPTTIL